MPGLRRPGLARIRPAPRGIAGALVALAVLAATPAHADWFEICRGLNLGGPSMQALEVPKGSLFRDNGRADDPLAAYGGEHWQLRLETLYRVAVPQLGQCVRVLVRITSDSAPKFVAASDGRRFVYAGSADLLDAVPPSEALLSAQGRVVDSVP